MTMAQQSHFLPYLDNLVQSRTEEHRYVIRLDMWKHPRYRYLLFVTELIMRFVFCQAVISAVPSWTWISETWLAGAGTHSWCSSTLWYHDSWWTAQVLFCNVKHTKIAFLSSVCAVRVNWKNTCKLWMCVSCCRWHSHCFSWGYGRLLSLLTRLPADLSSKEKIAETCRSHGYFSCLSEKRSHFCCRHRHEPVSCV